MLLNVASATALSYAHPFYLVNAVYSMHRYAYQATAYQLKVNTNKLYSDNGEVCSVIYKPIDLINLHSVISGTTPIIK